LLPYGGFGDWLSEHFPLTDRQARNLMSQDRKTVSAVLERQTSWADKFQRLVTGHEQQAIAMLQPFAPAMPYYAPTIRSDEYETPDYAVSPLLKYIPRNKVVWCPWDTADSEYVKQIGKTHKVVYSDNDFFDWEPKQWDILISNPPFSEKAKTFERVVSFCKPFACLVSLNWLHMRAPFRLIEPDLDGIAD